jgi:AraC family transcriptional regulator of adaptative response / DNA-3-methyladenine glycosylase II
MDDEARAEQIALGMVAGRLSGAALSGEERALVLTHFQTPADELDLRLRIDEAGRQLLAGDRKPAEIGEALGFSDPPTFHSELARRMAMPPAAYRALRGAARFSLTLPASYSRQRALAYLGRDPGSLTLRVAGEEMVLGLWLGGQPALLRATIARGEVRAEIGVPGPLPEGAAAEAHAALLRVLGLTRHPEPFEAHAAADPALAPLLAEQRGLRVPQTADPFDGLLWAIVGQQISLAFAFVLKRRLVERAGTPIPAGGGLSAPPTPERVAEIDLGSLTREQFSRRKAEYVVETARRIASGALAVDRAATVPATRIERELLAVRGLGPWSVHYLLMRAYGFEDAVPVGDAALTRALARYFALAERPGPAETLACMAPFSPYRSWATFHLWESLKSGG